MRPGACPSPAASRVARGGSLVAEVGRAHRRVAADLLGGARWRSARRSRARRPCRTAPSTAATSCSTMTSDSGAPLVHDPAEDTEQVLGRLEVETREGLVEQEDPWLAGQGATDLDQAEEPQRERRHRRLGHPGQPEQLEQAVDLFGLFLRGWKEGAGVEHVPPQARAGTSVPGGPARGARARSGPRTARAAGTSGPGPGFARCRHDTFVTSSPSSMTGPRRAAAGRRAPRAGSTSRHRWVRPGRRCVARLYLEGHLGERGQAAEANGDPGGRQASGAPVGGVARPSRQRWRAVTRRAPRPWAPPRPVAPAAARPTSSVSGPAIRAARRRRTRTPAQLRLVLGQDPVGVLGRRDGTEPEEHRQAFGPVHVGR